MPDDTPREDAERLTPYQEAQRLQASVRYTHDFYEILVKLISERNARDAALRKAKADLDLHIGMHAVTVRKYEKLRAALREKDARIEDLEVDAANDATRVRTYRREIFALVGIEGGSDDWPDFMVRLRAHLARPQPAAEPQELSEEEYEHFLSVMNSPNGPTKALLAGVNLLRSLSNPTQAAVGTHAVACGATPSSRTEGNSATPIPSSADVEKSACATAVNQAKSGSGALSGIITSGGGSSSEMAGLSYNADVERAREFKRRAGQAMGMIRSGYVVQPAYSLQNAIEVQLKEVDTATRIEAEAANYRHSIRLQENAYRDGEAAGYAQGIEAVIRALQDASLVETLRKALAEDWQHRFYGSGNFDDRRPLSETGADAALSVIVDAIHTLSPKQEEEAK